MPHNLFSEISIVLAIATVLATVMMLFRQSGILAYILTGVIIGPLGYMAFNSKGTLEVMSSIGITLLLFLVGLEMNPAGFRQVGKSAALIGFGQVVFTSLIGYVVATLLGFPTATAIFIALALTFSSTIIVVKLLSEKKDLGSLYGRIVIGVLLVQDFIALMALVILTSYGAGGKTTSIFSVLLILLKGGSLFLVLNFSGKRFLPKFIGFVARSQELLFLTSIAFALGVANIFASKFIGLSLEVGGFLAGIALSYSSESYHIHSRIRPLRDFFIVMFFIILGSTLALRESIDIWIPVLTFSFFVIIGNPLIVMVIMGLLGYKKRTSFMSGLAIAQVSEFSFVLIQLGGKVGYADERVIAIVTLTGIVTIAISSYLIGGSNWIYKNLSGVLKIFERKNTIEQLLVHKDMTSHVVLVGAHRLGGHLLSVFEKENTKIVDFNPDVIKKMEASGYYAVYGDISDEETQDEVNMLKSKLVLSTIPDMNDNSAILSRIKEAKLVNPPKVIVTANEEWEAKALYEEGADYVILPHFIGAQQIAHMIEEDHDLPRLKEYREKDLVVLG